MEAVNLAKTVVLSVGDSFHLESGKDRITYAGMVSENTYSIVQRKSQLIPFGWMGYAWNLFYPSTKKDINIDEVNIQIESVSPDEIRFNV
jgi:hypothetical protein